MKGRVPALDGIRGFALLAVLGYHTFPKVFGGGFLGVEIFFVLSGFLLTSLLLGEHDDGRIDVLAYYGRRIRRIFPALLVLLAVLLVVVPMVAHDDAFRLRGDVLSSIGGLTNWHLIASGSSYFDAAGRPSFVQHLWSVAIELQFYLVCPFIVAWAARRTKRIALAGLGGAIFASAVLMAVRYTSPDPSRAYFGTDTRISALLSGVLVAVVLHGMRERQINRRTLVRVAGGVAFVVLVVLAFAGQERARWMYPLGFLGVQAATGTVLAVSALGIWPERLFRTNALRWFGKRSYGIYLWHWPIAVMVRPGIDVGWPRAVSALVIVGGGCLLGALSYRWVERPFLVWRPQPWTFRDSRFGLSSAAAFGASVLVVATVLRPLPHANPIEESLVAGERALAQQNATPTPATPAPRVVAVVRGGRVVLAQPAPIPRPFYVPKGSAPGAVAVTAIGDSVMLGAVPSLKARLGSNSYIDAQKSRQFSAGIAVAHSLREQHRFGRVVIVHLGNNGPVKPSDIDAMMRELQGVPYVKFVTVRVDRGWQDSVNATLHDAAKRYKTVGLIDWYAYSNGQRDWFQSDGTHLRSSGAAAYAKLVGGSLPPPPTPTPKPTPKATPKPTPKPTPTPLLPPLNH